MAYDAPSLLASALAVLVVLLVGVFAWKRRSVAPAAETADLVKRAQDDRNRLLKARSHVELPDGSLAPKCAVKACDEPASRGRHRYTRNERMVDLVRRLFGAASRFGVAEDGWDRLRHCEGHSAAAGGLLRGKIIDVERRRNTAILNAELELSFYERVGVDAELDELEAKQAEASPFKVERSGDVVSIARAR